MARSDRNGGGDDEQQQAPQVLRPDEPRRTGRDDETVHRKEPGLPGRPLSARDNALHHDARRRPLRGSSIVAGKGWQASRAQLVARGSFDRRDGGWLPAGKEVTGDEYRGVAEA